MRTAVEAAKDRYLVARLDLREAVVRAVRAGRSLDRVALEAEMTEEDVQAAVDYEAEQGPTHRRLKNGKLTVDF